MRRILEKVDNLRHRPIFGILSVLGGGSAFAGLGVDRFRSMFSFEENTLKRKWSLKNKKCLRMVFLNFGLSVKDLGVVDRRFDFSMPRSTLSLVLHFEANWL